MKWYAYGGDEAFEQNRCSFLIPETCHQWVHNNYKTRMGFQGIVGHQNDIEAQWMVNGFKFEGHRYLISSHIENQMDSLIYNFHDEPKPLTYIFSIDEGFNIKEEVFVYSDIHRRVMLPMGGDAEIAILTDQAVDLSHVEVYWSPNGTMVSASDYMKLDMVK